MSEGNEFQVVADATEKARGARSVRVLSTFSTGASDNRSSRTGTVWIRSLRYAGVEDDDTFNVSDFNLYVTDSLANRQPVERPEEWIGITRASLTG